MSFIVIADGTHALPLATSQDHKRRDDGDRGPQYRRHGRLFARAASSRPRCTRASCARSSIPRCRALADEGMPYTGFLYAGLMIAPGRHAERARVQLPLRRSGDAAAPHAPAVRSHAAVRGGARRQARRSRAPTGTRARRSESSWPRRATPAVCSTRRCHRGTRPRGAPAGEGLPRRHAARMPATRARRTAAGCCARSAWAQSVRAAQSAGVRARRCHPLARRAVPARHRPPRARRAKRGRDSPCRGIARSTRWHTRSEPHGQ